MTDDDENVYHIHVICKNCGIEDWINIPKGKRVSETPCPNCGCYDLKAAI